MYAIHHRRPQRALVIGALLAAAVTIAGAAAPAAHAAGPTQAASGTEVAAFIRTEWWPQARTSVPGSDVGYETLPIKKVRCPRTVTATAGDSQTVLAAALTDLAAGAVAPAMDADTGVFTCVALLDRQRLLIGGAINEAGDAHFATASLLLSPSVMAESVAAEFSTQVGGTAAVVCSTRSVIVAQPDVPVRCKVDPDDGKKTVAEVVLAGDATLVSVDFARR